MKEGIKSIEIQPSSEYIDFIGHDNDPNIAEESQNFKGYVKLVATKAVRLKSITVKFMGETTVYHTRVNDQYYNEVISPILPKLKAKVSYKSAVLTPGEHTLPWELDIPNIYPRSFSNNKCSIKYKLEIKISFGIKSVYVDRAIAIKRHLLPSQELAPLINTKTFENSISNGFRYTLNIPRAVCLEQGYLPISIKYDYLDTSKKNLVKSISTQITQIEVYRYRNISKTEADMINTHKKNGAQSLYELYKSGDTGLSKLVRPNELVTTNILDKSYEDYSTIPLLLKHNLDILLTHGLESPLFSILHQLDIVFHFDQQCEDARVKVPILVSSVPDSQFVDVTTVTEKHNSKTRLLQKYTMERELHKLPFSVSNAEPSTPQPIKKTVDHHQTTTDESLMSQIKDGILSYQKTLRRFSSDLQLKKKITSDNAEVNNNVFEERHQSITALQSPPNSAKSTSSAASHKYMNNYEDTKSFESSSEKNSFSSPISPAFSTNELSSSPKSNVNEIKPVSIGSFVGLSPPPRPTKKKETPIMEERNKVHQPTLPITPKSPKMTSPPQKQFLPLPPIPIADQTFTSLPKRQVLSQSKSTCTTTSTLPSNTYPVKKPQKKRSNSIHHQYPLFSSSFEKDQLLDIETYSNSITNHYVRAELPPLPKNFAVNQKAPLIRSKTEHRKTRMYYDDDSDEEDLEDYDVLFSD